MILDKQQLANSTKKGIVHLSHELSSNVKQRNLNKATDSNCLLEANSLINKFASRDYIGENDTEFDHGTQVLRRSKRLVGGLLSVIGIGLSIGGIVQSAVSSEQSSEELRERKRFLGRRLDNIDVALNRNLYALGYGLDRNYGAIREVEGKVDRNLYVLGYGLDRNYGAIREVEGKVDRNLYVLGYGLGRNYGAIREVEGKVDRNLYVLDYGLSRNFDANHFY